jgi:hypothetical protein
MKPSTSRVLGLLREAGDDGMSTGDFARAYCARFGARLKELRAVGCDIEAERIDAHSFRYFLRHEPDDLETGGVPPAALPHPQPTAISPAEDAAAPGAGQLFDTVPMEAEAMFGYGNSEEAA